MAKLDISGSFLITIGRGNGPETWVVLSISDETGAPVNPHEAQIQMFVALSAMFGAFEISVHIAEFQDSPFPPGFCSFRISIPGDLGQNLHDIRASVLGVVVTTKTHRGQAMICDCGVAGVSNWLPNRVRNPND